MNEDLYRPGNVPGPHVDTAVNIHIGPDRGGRFMVSAGPRFPGKSILSLGSVNLAFDSESAARTFLSDALAQLDDMPSKPVPLYEKPEPR